MPPQVVDVDSSYQDDLHRLCDIDELPSPLFRDDHDCTVPSSSDFCRLLRRQANPEFAAAIASSPSRERTISSEDALTTTPTKLLSQRPHFSTRQVSRITEIIGPESAYVKSSVAASSSSSSSDTTHPSASLIATDETTVLIPREVTTSSPSSSTEEEKVLPSSDVGGSKQQEEPQQQSLFRRFTSKFKRVKSLPIRLASKVGTAKVGHQVNVI